jgi:anti-sigma B factor antagonist
MLITLDKQVKESKGSLKLSNINPQIYEVFKITRLNKLFDIHEEASEAQAAF